MGDYAKFSAGRVLVGHLEAMFEHDGELASDCGPLAPTTICGKMIRYQQLMAYEPLIDDQIPHT